MRAWEKSILSRFWIGLRSGDMSVWFLRFWDRVLRMFWRDLWKEKVEWGEMRWGD